ncbi:MAG TPA: hypothetical protein VF030_06400, partial [Solirubrobacterales bacterium]
SCPAAFTGCHRGQVVVRAATQTGRRQGLRAGRFLVAEGGFAASGGQTKPVRLPLTPTAQAFFGKRRTLLTQVTVSSAESAAVDKRYRVPRRSR